MAKRYTLQVATRTETASKARQTGNIPGVLYGQGIEAVTVEVVAKDFDRVYREAGETSLVTLSLKDGKEYPVIIRETQLHPIKGHVTHVDFYQVRMDEEIRANVPLEFVGVAPAVKDLGGVLLRSMDEIEIEALPQDLPPHIEVDITPLDSFDKVIRIEDLKLPEGVKVLQEAEEVVVLVQAPRTEQELEALTEEVKEDVESVEGVKKEEPAEGEAAEGAAEEKKE